MEEMKIKLQEKYSGLGSFIRWEGIENLLKSNGYLRKDESITNLTIDKNGIHYYITAK